MELNYNLSDLRKILNEERVEGNTKVPLNAIGSLELAQVGDISFLANGKYRAKVKESAASVILVPEDYSDSSPKADQAFIRVKNPSYALAQICAAIERKLCPQPDPGIDPSAVVHPNAKVSAKAYVGPFCYIGDGAQLADGVSLAAHNFVGVGAFIGEGSRLLPYASVMHYCRVGKNNTLHPQAVIGSDGFGYSTVNGVHSKEPQVGIVVLEDDVDVGASSTIDRARFSETRIGEGTKIDNLVQIGHNVTVGKRCFIVAQAGVAGSTVIEDDVIIGGQVGIAGHLRIASGAIIGAKSGVNSNVTSKGLITGTPPYPMELLMRIEVYKKRLPEIFKRVERLEAALSPGN